jgi:hypothetical protein
VNSVGGSCLDLAAFYNGLSRMPTDGWVRTHTVNMTADDHNTKLSDKVEIGGSPRGNFLSELFFSNFQLIEQSTPDFQRELQPVQQVGCEKVLIGKKEYAVREAHDSMMRIAVMTQVKGKDGAMVPYEKESLTYFFRSPRSLDIVSHHLAQDPCQDFNTVFVTKTTRMTWGHTSDPALNQPQEINPAYVRRATHALFNPPSQVANVDGDGSALITMNLADMQALRASELRRDIQVCPYHAQPAHGEDPEADLDPDVATPTPAPEAASSAAADENAPPGS